jgi:magnesium transporter
MAYGPGDFVEAEVADLHSLRSYLETWPVTWINVEGLGDVHTVETLGEIFGLHHLALEDVLNVHQRAKVDEFEDQLFIVSRMARFTDELETEQVSFFLGRNFVLTFQEGRPWDCFDAIRNHVRNKVGRLRHLGPDYLVYCLIDAIIDHYFPLLEEYGERLEKLEAEVIAHPTQETIHRLHAIKRHLLELRRIVWPMRDALQIILRDTDSLFTSETRVYLRDCYDHVVQVVELSEIYRELAMSLTDVYLSSISNRMNEIMKVLAVIATIFMPLSFLASLYGMNFNTDASPFNMPELRWYFGYPFVLSVMFLVAFGMLVYFYRKGWLAPSIPTMPSDEEDDRRESKG